MRIPGKPGKPPRFPKVSKGAPPRPPKLPHRVPPASARVIQHPADALMARQLAVQVTSDGWPTTNVSPFKRARLGAQPEGSSVKPSLGSVLHYTPDASGWMAQLSNEDGAIWCEPVVGWAVVVCWTAYDSDDPAERDQHPDQYETRLEPMIFSGQDIRPKIDLGEDITFNGLIRPGHVPPALVPQAPEDEATDHEVEN